MRPASLWCCPEAAEAAEGSQQDEYALAAVAKALRSVHNIVYVLYFTPRVAATRGKQDVHTCRPPLQAIWQSACH